MIFLFAVGIEELAAAALPAVEDVINRLVEADRRGRHYVVITRVAADWVLQNATLSQSVRGHLIALKQAYAIRGAMPESAGTFLEVRLGSSGVSLRADGSFEVGHEAFLLGSFSDVCAALVLEDIVSDAGLYRQILNEARKLTKVPSFRFEPIHSGGSRVAEVFDVEIGKNKVVTCLVDTDRPAPMASKTGTARAVLHTREIRNGNSVAGALPFVGDAIAVPGHELENCIPYVIIKDMDGGDVQTRTVLDAIIQQDTSPVNEDCFWLFFDIKNGLLGSKILDKLSKGNISPEAVAWICGKLGVPETDLSTISLPGWGDNVVPSLLKSPLKLAELHKFTRTAYWRSVFLPTFERLLWFFCAPNQDRV